MNTLGEKLASVRTRAPVTDEYRDIFMFELTTTNVDGGFRTDADASEGRTAHRTSRTPTAEPKRARITRASQSVPGRCSEFVGSSASVANLTGED